LVSYNNRYETNRAKLKELIRNARVYWSIIKQDKHASLRGIAYWIIARNI